MAIHQVAGIMGSPKNKRNWKQLLFREFSEYMVNVAYMSIMFSAVIFYRRLVLAHYDIYLDDYFSGVFKALVIGKVVMAGAFMSISRKFEHKPLIFPVLYKTVLFTFLVILFDIAEMFIRGLVQTPALGEAVDHLGTHLNRIWIGGAMLIFFIFIPFFAFKELVRVIGKDKIKNLFFREQS
jgi:hypothetical protein